MQLRNPILVGTLTAWTLVLASCGRHTATLAPNPDVAGDAALIVREDPDGPPTRSLHRGFYPLDLGNRWAFSGRLTIRSGRAGEPLQTVYSASRSVDVRLTCAEPIAGHDYVVERSLTLQDGVTYPSWVRYRQDAAGLYEADVTTSIPPACEEPAPQDAAVVHRARSLVLETTITDPARRAAVEAAWQRLQSRVAALGFSPGQLGAAMPRPGGPKAGELTRLKYPLRVGQRWLVRDEPDFQFFSWVEAILPLRTPAGWFLAHRVRIANSNSGPEDRVVLLFSRRGLIGVSAHLVDRGTDQDGFEVITIYDDVLKLVDLELAHQPS